MATRDLNLNTLFYSSASGQPLKCCPGKNVGMEFEGASSKSALRPASSMDKRSKLSAAAAVIDDLLAGSNGWKGAWFGNSCFLGTLDLSVFVGADGFYHATRDMKPMEICTATLFVLIRRAQEENPDAYREVQASLYAITREYAREGRVSAEALALFCDAFYYGLVKGAPKIPIDYELSAAEVEAGIRARQDEASQFSYGDNQLPFPAWVAPVAKAGPAATWPKETPEEVLSKAKDGEYIVPFEWDEESQPYRPGLQALGDFVPNQTFASLLRKIKVRMDKVLSRMGGLDLSRDEDRLVAIGHDYVNVTLTGKPGTGKTRIGHALAAATGMPVYVISNSHNTDEDAYEGMTKMVDGLPTAVLTDTVRCFENGGILLLEEINLPQAAVVMGALGQAVEFPFILKKDGYRPIRRHPLCVIISTMNTGTAGSKVLSQPFANRFKQSFVLDDPERDEFVGILQSATGCGRAACLWTYECYGKIVRCIEGENAVADTESILLSLSMRSCIGALENMQEGMEPKEAVKHSIIGKIAEQDRDVAASCLKVVGTMREPRFEM